MSKRRVTVVASELLGRAGTGGAGTADSLLAVALGRHGHDVELLIASGRDIGSLDEEWTRIYAEAGVSVRVLQRMHGVRPPYHAPTLEVFHALRDRQPDVVIADDWRGLAHAALRARQTGRTLQDTAFVVHCHGPGRVLAEFAAKVPDTLARFAEEVMERTSVELADAVVSPSRWLLDWMGEHGWPVPDTARVIQYVRESAALEAPAAARGYERAAIRRLAFFGQLREGKGVRIFLAALERLRDRLDGMEVVFLGAATPRWSAERIRAAWPAARVETELGHKAALAELRRPGTLAVMPSLLDNSPNTVSECIEQGIPFVATATGGIPELVAADDQARVLCAPTADDLAAALGRVLASENGFLPARPAREPRESLEAWLEVVETVQPTRATPEASDPHAFVPVGFDSADDELREALAAAQAASGADVVTTAVRPAVDPDGIHPFLGDPGALGLVENQYGVLGLVRRSLLEDTAPQAGAVDPQWPLFARLALAGARIVSIPEALATYDGSPGRVGDVPGEALAVLRLFEQADPTRLADLPQLAATLAAAHARATRPGPAPPRPSLLRRALRFVRP
jgi:glycosyltransferase involved in cell wall biosynthesis